MTELVLAFAVAILATSFLVHLVRHAEKRPKRWRL